MQEYFSSRYNYQPKRIKKIDEIDDKVKNRIWNLFVKCVDVLRRELEGDYFIEKLWDEFFKERIDDLEYSSFDYMTGKKTYSLENIEFKFNQLKWYEYYDFLEFLMKESPLKGIISKEANKIFEDENMECRVINYMIVPLIGEEEIREIEMGQKISDRYEKVRVHLKKAVELYAKRPQPDYKNSIKDSISAIEALTKIVTNKPSATGVDLLKQFSSRFNLHPAFIEGLSKIYGWTSDEGGIRHSEKKYPYLESGKDEARLMLVLCHAFVNYIIQKYENQKDEGR